MTLPDRCAGLSWGQAAALLRERRRVTSFDVCGMTDSAEDGALAAALVYRLAGCALHAEV
ncbi:MAG: hypothetical protein ACI8S6_000485 [Myxococcota bacterium]|jgi:hypothetical protein